MRYIHRLFTYVSVGLHTTQARKLDPESGAILSPLLSCPISSISCSPLPFSSPRPNAARGSGELRQRGPGLRANLFFGHFKPRKHVWWH